MKNLKRVIEFMAALFAGLSRLVSNPASLQPPLYDKDFLLDKITDVVADTTNLHQENIRGKVRKRELVEARFICYCLIRKYLPYATLETIGTYFSGRDHSSVIYGLQTSEDLRDTDRKFKTKYQLSEERLIKELVL